jgi:hypothetical protein
VTALDRTGTEAPGSSETVRPEAARPPISVEQSADLQSSRVPRPDCAPVACPEPFYREVWLNRADLAKIETDVDQQIAAGKGSPDQRASMIQAEKDVAFATKARDGDFYSLNRYGTLESTMYNALPPQWYGEAAQSRLLEVTPSPGTTYYVGAAAPQGSVQGWGADLPGRGQQVFVPRDTDRTGWEVRPVARSQAELATLPQGSVVGYDDVGDITVTPDSAHAGDKVVAVHLAGNGNPFEGADDAARTYALVHDQRWSGPTADKFAGSIEERVTPAAPVEPPPRVEVPPAPAPADPLLGQGPLVSDRRDGPLIR